MKRKLVLYLILLVLLAGGMGIGYYYWYQEANYVSTEDARLAGDIYRVVPRIPGEITSLSIKEGDTVTAGQIVGRQDVSNLPTGLLENAMMRSPVAGVVIKTLVKVGEVVGAGQPVAMVVNKSNLYVLANIEETDRTKISLGQIVEFTVDSFSGYMLTGKVSEIGEATVSTFSLLPATNTSGNFTKVTQRIPIKISIDDNRGLDLSPGMSAIIKIHLKGN